MLRLLLHKMEKIAKIRRDVREMLSSTVKPAVLCSFGKDSCTMLHFVREQMPDIPVVYFRAFDHPTKHQFADQQIKDLGLNIIEPLPYFRDLISNGQTVQLVEVYAPGLNLHFPIESDANYLADRRSHCALEKLQAPTIETAWEFDCLFIGHRGDDTDPFWGEIGAQQPAITVGDCTVVYPLLDWTEADIWQVSKELNIPQNWARYEGEMRANNDYYDLCTNCLKPNGETKSFCPKVGADIDNIAEAAGVVQQSEIWKSRFLNLRSNHATN